MTKTISANSKILTYLQSLNVSDSLHVGLVFGQTWEATDYIVHLAKTSSSVELKNISDINLLSLADHAKLATKMLSGGTYVIGIFIVSEADMIVSIPSYLRKVINRMERFLSSEFLYGNNETEEIIILNYCSKSKNIKCKLYNAITNIAKPIELKYFDDIKWVKLECKYEILKNYFWEEKKPDMDLKDKINVILGDVSNSLKSSVILFDGEYKSEDESLESMWKKKKTSKSGRSNYENDDNSQRQILVNILETCEDVMPSDASVRDTTNQIKVIGQISSTVWMHPSSSYKKASVAVIQDIIRSLSTRLEMHCDSLIEEEHKEDSNSIHEPPRRVMIAIPGSDITVSDYLFPGEGAEEAKNYVEEILDIKLNGSPDEIQEVEGSIDLTNYEGNISQIAEGKISKQDKDTGHRLFMIGSVFALMVLIISIIMHFIWKSY